MIRPTLRPLLALAIGIVAVGCAQLRGGAYRYIEREPDTAELLGSWRLTAASLAKLEKAGFSRLAESDHGLRLDPDGRCSFRSFFSYNVPDEAEYLEGVACAWRVTRWVAYVHHRRLDVPAVELELSRGGEVCPPPAPGEPERLHEMWMMHLYITEQDGGLLLWSHIGDPDYERYADWVR